MSGHTQLTIFGAGAFGSALAVAFAERFDAVHLIARSERRAAQLTEACANTTHLPGVPFPSNVKIFHEIGEAHEVLWAVPAQAVGATLAENAHLLTREATVIVCAKGLDLKSGPRLSKVAEAAVPGVQIGFLSGPGFATDIGAGLPTAMTLALRTGALELAQKLSTRRLRLYATDDVTGVELGGALKNVIAIAAGVAMGARYGESARAALVTRGFAEMCRMAQALGARPETLTGLSGFGDLMLTAASDQSRNVAYGRAIGSGAALPQSLAEGAKTASVALELAVDLGVDTPVIAQTVALIEGRCSVGEAMDALLSRDVRSE